MYHMCRKWKFDSELIVCNLYQLLPVPNGGGEWIYEEEEASSGLGEGVNGREFTPDEEFARYGGCKTSWSE